MEIPGDEGEYRVAPWSGKSLGSGGQTEKKPLWGVLILSRTTHCMFLMFYCIRFNSKINHRELFHLIFILLINIIFAYQIDLIILIK